ncbi:hypothetical protein [Floridanema aerugineum]|uniref:DUF4278 domain-containing protein n=1 Tax=Floridaenema aerugineum BLCC-F46 TaxID=3153654 RepID=A0ABV4X4F0_9CYAN
MQLIYRGHIYNYTPAAPKPYVKPRALNWRYQVAGETYQAKAETTQYVKPRAINWRYQMSLSI